jgi:hypothetical protein
MSNDQDLLREVASPQCTDHERGGRMRSVLRPAPFVVEDGQGQSTRQYIKPKMTRPLSRVRTTHREAQLASHVQKCISFAA